MSQLHKSPDAPGHEKKSFVLYSPTAGHASRHADRIPAEIPVAPRLSPINELLLTVDGHWEIRKAGTLLLADATTAMVRMLSSVSSAA